MATSRGCPSVPALWHTPAAPPQARKTWLGSCRCARGWDVGVPTHTPLALLKLPCTQLVSPGSFPHLHPAGWGKKRRGDAGPRRAFFWSETTLGRCTPGLVGSLVWGRTGLHPTPLSLRQDLPEELGAVPPPHQDVLLQPYRRPYQQCAGLGSLCSLPPQTPNALPFVAQCPPAEGVSNPTQHLCWVVKPLHGGLHRWHPPCPLWRHSWRR